MSFFLCVLCRKIEEQDTKQINFYCMSNKISNILGESVFAIHNHKGELNFHNENSYPFLLRTTLCEFIK